MTAYGYNEVDDVTNRWQKLLGEHPNELAFHDELAASDAGKGNRELAITGRIELVCSHPDNETPLHQLILAYRARGESEIDESTGSNSIVVRLCNSLGKKGDNDTAIDIWKKILMVQSDLVVVQQELAKAYEKKGDDKAALEGWKELLRKSPDVPGLNFQLPKISEKLRIRNCRLSGICTVLRELFVVVKRHILLAFERVTVAAKEISSLFVID
jgi:tetratricopeptide (TPR) repeat protein